MTLRRTSAATVELADRVSRLGGWRAPAGLELAVLASSRPALLDPRTYSIDSDPSDGSPHVRST